MGAYLGFHSMKQQGVLPVQLPLGCNTGPSLGYSPAFYQTSMRIGQYPFILLGRERHCENEVFCLRTQQNDLARSQTQTSPARVKRTNHYAAA